MPTALELTREGWKRYLKGAQPQPAISELSPAEQKERERLLERVRKAASLLKSRFGARRVILFGSLAHPFWFGLESDVDLAVDGLVGGVDYWDAWKAVEEIIDDRPVDLIDIDMASKSLIQAIERYGVEL